MRPSSLGGFLAVARLGKGVEQGRELVYKKCRKRRRDILVDDEVQLAFGVTDTRNPIARRGQYRLLASKSPCGMGGWLLKMMQGIERPFRALQM
jgi:hypothetical protein